MSNTAVQGLKKEDSGLNTSFRKIGASVAAAAQLVTASLPSAASLGFGAAALGVGTQRGDSAVMLSATSFPGQDYINAAAPYVNNGSVVAIRITDPITGLPNYASAYKISPTEYVTAAHVLSKSSGLADSSNVSILVGPNYYTPTLEASVASYRIHPSFVLGSAFGTGSQIDLAVVTTTQSILGTNIQFASQTPANGTTIDFVGFGRPQLEYQGQVALDGFARMFQARAINPSVTFNNDLYGAGSATLISSNILGVGSVDDSGGLVSYQGLGIGLMIASGSVTTTWLDMTRPEVQSFIIPEPSAAMMALAGTSLLLARRRRN